MLSSLTVQAEDEDVFADEDSLFVESIWADTDYTGILYDNTNGLPTSEANDIAETREGFIWIGSYSGLVRYDGNTFERVDRSSGINNVNCLHVDQLDNLWIGTNDNGVFRMDFAGFTHWGEAEGLPASSVRAIAETEDGIVYVSTTSGVSMIGPDDSLRILEDPRIQNQYIGHLQIGSDGLLYGLTNSGDVFTVNDGQVEDFIDHTASTLQGIGCIYPDPDHPGYVYLETLDGQVFYGKIENDFSELYALDVGPLSPIKEFEKINDKVWICSANGIGFLDADGFHMVKGLPMKYSVCHVGSDYEGNLWFTSTRQGVMKVCKNQFTNLNQKYLLDTVIVNTTCRSGGLLYIGSDSGLTVVNGQEICYQLPLTKAQTASGKDLDADDLIRFLRGCRIRSIIEDSKGQIWISTWQKYGLLCYKDGELIAYTPEDGLFSDHVRCIYECKDGSILVANTGGVSVIRDGQVTESYGSESGIENTEILTVTEASNGDIVMGSDGGGIYVISSSGTKHLGKEDGLTSDIILRIKHDAERDLFWIVTGNSLSYMTADYEIVTIKDFPYSNNFDLFENSRNEMWILSSNGIYVTQTDELLANEEIHADYYSIANGLPSIATANSYSCLTEDGDLFIAGVTGISKVNIETFQENINELKLSVPYVDADDTRIYPDRYGRFTVPSGVRRLTIYGFVFNYSLIDPLVTYQLEGFDTDGITQRRSDLTPVTYTNLRGGSYTFVMQLLNQVGTDTKSISVQIIKAKAIYEHVWFYILCAAGVAALIVLLARHYTRRKIRALEQKHQEEAEKQRISTELSMGSRIQASMLPHTFPPFPDRTEFDLYASMDPAREVGGDFYDFYMIDDDHLGLVIADVSGKGVPAALFMMVSKVILQSCAMLGAKPGEILQRTNEAICSNNQVEMFVTVWLGILEISTGRIVAANAGHEYPAIEKNGTFTLLKDKHGLVIGAMDGMKYQEYEIRLDPGDKLFVYTDGVPESTDADSNMFGTDRMLKALNADPDASPEQILKKVRRSVDNFVREAEQFDDLTMLCLEYKGTKATS